MATNWRSGRTDPFLSLISSTDGDYILEWKHIILVLSLISSHVMELNITIFFYNEGQSGIWAVKKD